jgi:hypothetical protein
MNNKQNKTFEDAIDHYRMRAAPRSQDSAQSIFLAIWAIALLVVSIVLGKLLL